MPRISNIQVAEAGLEKPHKNLEDPRELPTAATTAATFDDAAFAELLETWQAADSEMRASILEAVRLLRESS